MHTHRVRNIALLLAAVVLVAGALFVYGKSATNTAYDIPRMLGMEGEEAETIQRAGAPSTDVQGPFFETTDPAVSLDVDLRNLPKSGPKVVKLMAEMGKMRPAPSDLSTDPVLQTGSTVAGEPISAVLAPAPSPIISFKGLDFANWGGGWPPDTHGDVGPTHYIQAVNTSVGIFDKATGTRLAAFTIDDFFTAAGASSVCATGNYGDPIVLYDQISGRWIMTDFAWLDMANGPYYECIAVSKGADPVSGGWWVYNFAADATALNDYPKLGVWNDGIYMSSNLFDCLNSNCSSANYDGVKVWTLNRADLISGAALRSIAFNVGSAYFSLLPANQKGTPAPDGTPEYFLSDYDVYGSTNTMKMWKFTTDWATPANSTLSGPTSFTVASYIPPSDFSNVPELNGVALDSLGDRLMTWLQYRNINGVESLWVSRTVKASALKTNFGIRWTEIRNMKTTPSVHQQGTYAPDNNYRWMPSLAVDQLGNMAVGYSVSSATTYPSIRYAGRLVTDPLNTLGQTETTLIAGTGSQTGFSRWGDYSSMSIDPVDDCTFWYTSEYYETTSNNWQTRIGSFRYSTCGGVPTSTFKSSGAYDGYILESGENTSVGGTATATGSFLIVGDNAYKKQYRTILHFDTSGLPDNATITGLTLAVKRAGFSGVNPFNVLGSLQVDIADPFFGSSATLVASDFEAGNGFANVGSFNPDLQSGNWYTASLDSSAFPYLNLTGSTQFRLAFSIDDNNNGIADTLRFYSGNTFNAAYRPLLTITYTLP
jgi:hypothetical protein